MSRRVARAVAGKADGAWHWAWLAWVALAATLVSMLRAHWPEFYEFAALPSISGWSRLVHTPVHLDDDVMIALRSGYMVEQVDMPSYNRGDVAQPATSYLAPYFFLLLYKLLPGYLPGYLPVLAYALLGVAGVGLTMSALVWSAASRPVLATVLVMLLLCTRTNAVFALSGWDHLFQALLLTVAVVMVLRRGRSAAFYAGAVGLAAAGALYRPDGLLIALAVLAVGAVHAPQRRGAMLCGLVFVGLIGAAMVVNWLQFGQLTPTTARLKIGASPSLHYSLNYLYVNGWRRFSAITLCGVLTLVLLWRAQRLPGAVRTILAACLATLGLTTLNSDVFSGARMFWMPACVLSALVLSTASARPGGAPIATGTTIMPGARRDTMLAAIGLAVLVALAWRLPAKSPHVVRVDQLRAAEPACEVLANRVFVHDGPVWTSAGVTCGIDLALHRVAAACGAPLAARVAQSLVVALRRGPQDAELSPFLRHRSHLHPAVHRVQDALSLAPQRNWPLAAMADVAHTSPRHLTRLFAEHAGTSPQDYLRTLRLSVAQAALQAGRSVTQAAELAGFSSDSQLRRAWHQAGLAHSPAAGRVPATTD